MKRTKQNTGILIFELVKHYDPETNTTRLKVGRVERKIKQ